MRVAFLGPPGTFTEEALQASIRGEAEQLPVATVREAVMAVQTGDVGRAVVPIENALEGSVRATLDTLAGDAPDVRIEAQVTHPIHHCLIAPPSVALDALTRVVSHPHAISQCRRFLRERLPRAERAAAASTAEAVRLVSAAGEQWAAIGSRLSAERYGCKILAENVEDRPDNLTRFVWLAPATAAVAAGTGPRKTSIVFWGFNDRSPGGLVSVLREIADREINLTRIESRPRRAVLGRYMFFADLEGDVADAAVAGALNALAGRVESLRVLGSYPLLGSPQPGLPAAGER